MFADNIIYPLDVGPRKEIAAALFPHAAVVGRFREAQVVVVDGHVLAVLGGCGWRLFGGGVQGRYGSFYILQTFLKKEKYIKNYIKTYGNEVDI